LSTKNTTFGWTRCGVAVVVRRKGCTCSGREFPGEFNATVRFAIRSRNHAVRSRKHITREM